MRSGPFLGDGQTSATVEVGRIATGVFPLAGAFRKPGARAQTGSVHVDPLAQLRPVADQHLLRYLHKGIPVSKDPFRSHQRSISKLLPASPLGIRSSDPHHHHLNLPPPPT